MTHDRFSGQVAFITGGANGIGRACAKRFVDDGGRVMIADIVESHAESCAAEFGPSAAWVRCDVTDEQSIIDAISTTMERFGRIDAVVASAGKGGFSPIVDHPLDLWNDVVGLCLTGVFLTIKHAARSMNDGGSIVTISSLNGVQQAEGMAAYCAAKSGVIALTRVAAMELGRRSIRVNAVLPGLVETQLTQGFWHLPGMVEEFLDNAPLGEYSQPDDIAAVVTFLLSNDARLVTAGIHNVDGGASTKRYPDVPRVIERAMSSGHSIDQPVERDPAPPSIT